MGRAMLRAAVAASLLCSAGAAQAADFLFSFSSDLSDPNTPNAVDGTVTGRIIGLADDGTSSATSVLVDSYSPDGTLSTPIDVTQWFTQWENSFTVSGDDIVAAIFWADDDFINPSFDRFIINVVFAGPDGANYASIGSNNAVSIWNNQGLNGITFTRIDGAVPEPATWAMMMLGFAAAGLALRTRRKPALA